MRSRIASAAALIAVLTVLSRIVGFGRSVVFMQAVGVTPLGDAYNAANTVPNILFEIVAGGALAGLVVPLLAGPLAAGDRRAVGRTVSALLTWTLTLLVPLAVLVVVLADPIMSLIAPKFPAEQHDSAVFMLRIFAPQIPLYGIGLVLGGVLQAHRRFMMFALSPLLSSLTAIATYVYFAAKAGSAPVLSTVDHGELVILAAGTTLGVVVLSLCLIFPVSRLGLHLRPTYDIEPGQRRAVGGLALSGVFTVGMQQIAVVVAIALATAAQAGTLVAYNFAQTVYLLPWAVLAVPVATASYPDIANSHAVNDRDRLARQVARSGRVITLLSCLGAAGLVAVAFPAAQLVLNKEQQDLAPMLAAAIMALAPGLLGYGIGALYQRTLYAVHAYKDAALGVGLGWLVTIGSAFALSELIEERAVALALANSIGMTVLGLGLAIRIVKRCGRDAVRGMARPLVAGVVAAVAGAVAGRLIVSEPTPDALVLIGQCMLSGGIAAGVFAAVCAALDWRDLQPLLARVRRKAGGE